jgi:hypothetical protein
VSGAGGSGVGGGGGATVSSAGSGGVPDEDADGDGFTATEGDCDDTAAEVNPAAVEMADGKDDDCNGVVDDVPAPCDAGLAIDDADPLAAARAIELCKVAASSLDWGLLKAAWVLADGKAPPTDAMQLEHFHLGHGLLGGFGPYVSPRSGNRILGLATDTARSAGDPDFYVLMKSYVGGAPEDFPTDSPCGSVEFGPHEQVALELEIRAPSNARGFRFSSNLYTGNWPVNPNADVTFSAIVSPPPAGALGEYISFDSNGYSIHTCTPLLEVCWCERPPCVPPLFPRVSFPCSQGDTELQGTGYEGNAATGWLLTTAPVGPNEVITVRFAIGAADPLFQAISLVDDWQWLTSPETIVATSHL